MQLREALALPCCYRYVLFDRDAKFGSEVWEFLKASGIQPLRTSVRSPWQNGIAERWIGSVRREVLDHVIPLNEQLCVIKTESRLDRENKKQVLYAHPIERGTLKRHWLALLTFPTCRSQ